MFWLQQYLFIGSGDLRDGLVRCPGVRATHVLSLRCHWLSLLTNWPCFKVIHFYENEWFCFKVLNFLNFVTFAVGSNEELALGGYLSGYCMVVLRQRPMH